VDRLGSGVGVNASFHILSGGFRGNISRGGLSHVFERRRPYPFIFISSTLKMWGSADILWGCPPLRFLPVTVSGHVINNLAPMIQCYTWRLRVAKLCRRFACMSTAGAIFTE